MLLGVVEPEPLNRVFLELGPFTIYWYGVLIATGAMLGLWMAVRESDKLGLPKDIFIDLLLYALPIAIICARAYYVTFEWSYYSEHPEDIIKIWHGGIAIHGALLGGFATGYFFSKKRGVSFFQMADIAAPSILIGQIIGRWGNFMNQEAHGGVVSREFLEKLHLPTFIIDQMYIDGEYYHPTFLYESLWNVVGLLLIIFLLRPKNLIRGEIFFSYVIWYSVGRFFIEGMRTDSLMFYDVMRMAQFISIILIAISIICIVYRRKILQVQDRYLD